MTLNSSHGWRKGFTIRLRHPDSARLVNFDLLDYDLDSKSWYVQLGAGQEWEGSVPTRVTQGMGGETVVAAP